MSIQVTHFASDGRPVTAGLCVAHKSNLTGRLVTFQAVCDSVDPMRWHGEAQIGSRCLVKTDAFESERQAGKAAEDAFVDRLVALFRADIGE